MIPSFYLIIAACLAGLVLVVFLTAMLQLRAQVKRLNRQLTAERAELANAMHEIAHAKERIDAANRAKTDFLANMSHEIRTPIGVISGMAELLLLKPSLTPEQTKFVQSIHTSAGGLIRILNDILDFSKLGEGKMRLRREFFNLKSVIEEVGDFYHSAFQQKRLDFEMLIDPNLPAMVEGDPSRIRQILLNLIGNALKFTQRGRVLIRVHCLDHESNSVKLRFEVQDSGIGIPYDKQESIFQKFSQGDDSDSRSFSGTGLGLAISQELLGLMNSRMQVQSLLGEGSLFFFDLDLPVPAQAAVKEEKPAQSSRSDYTDISVMVAEDHSLNQELLRSLLNKLNCTHIDIAANGREAVSLYHQNHYDLILMDCQMPEMDGFEATRQIREMEAQNDRHVPIVALTADIVKADKDKCLAAGMDGHLNKPITLAKLENILDFALDYPERESSNVARVHFT